MWPLTLIWNLLRGPDPQVGNLWTRLLITLLFDYDEWDTLISGSGLEDQATVILWNHVSPSLFFYFELCVHALVNDVFLSCMNKVELSWMCYLSVSGRLWSRVSAVTDDVVNTIGQLIGHRREMKRTIFCKVTENFPASSEILRTFHQHGRWTETLQRESTGSNITG